MQTQKSPSSNPATLSYIHIALFQLIFPFVLQGAYIYIYDFVIHITKIKENVFCKSKNDVILFIHGSQAI
jgi:hypothetical protein